MCSVHVQLVTWDSLTSREAGTVRQPLRETSMLLLSRRDRCIGSFCSSGYFSQHMFELAWRWVPIYIRYLGSISQDQQGLARPLQNRRWDRISVMVVTVRDRKMDNCCALLEMNCCQSIHGFVTDHLCWKLELSFDPSVWSYEAEVFALVKTNSAFTTWITLSKLSIEECLFISDVKSSKGLLKKGDLSERVRELGTKEWLERHNSYSHNGWHVAKNSTLTGLPLNWRLRIPRIGCQYVSLLNICLCLL